MDNKSLEDSENGSSINVIVNVLLKNCDYCGVEY